MMKLQPTTTRTEQPSNHCYPHRYAVHVKENFNLYALVSWLVMFDDSGCRHGLIVNFYFYEKHAICHKICIFSI